RFSVGRDDATEFGRARLRVTWDGRKEASIDAPVALFFGAGVLYNRDGREFLVKGFSMQIRYNSFNQIELVCFFPMPFFRSAKIELVGDRTDIHQFSYSICYAPCKVPKSHLGYFHATYRDFPKPEFGKDLVLLDTRTTEGGGDWSGNFVGTSFI